MALLEEPWLQALLCAPGTSKLWRHHKRVVKELSEGVAVLQLVRAARRRWAARTGEPLGADGEGALVFDVCCGKGIGALLLSHALPAARLVLVDNDERMDLSHLQHRLELGRMEFLPTDVFSRAFEAALARRGAEARWGCMVGTHLCGALSPRLISTFAAAPAFSYLVLSPCCLKGWLGKEVQVTTPPSPPRPRPLAVAGHGGTPLALSKLPALSARPARPRCPRRLAPPALDPPQRLCPLLVFRQRRAKSEGRAHYTVLLEELASLATSATRAGADATERREGLRRPAEVCPELSVQTSVDVEVLSQKNGYVLCERLR